MKFLRFFLIWAWVDKTAITLTALFDLCLDSFLVRKVLVIAPLRVAHDTDIMIKFTAPVDRIVHGPARVTDKVTDGVTVVERRILDALLTDPGYSYAALAENLSLSRKTVAEHIKRLKEKRIIERIGNNKRGYWRING